MCLLVQWVMPSSLPLRQVRVMSTSSKKMHIAINTHDLDASIQAYQQRLNAKPVLVVPNEYALWRTDNLNFSVRQNLDLPPGVRHLGWEDEQAGDFTEERDVNGILWEHFAFAQQRQEILALWPDAAW